MRVGDQAVQLRVGGAYVSLQATATTMSLDLCLPKSQSFRVFWVLSDTLHRTLQSTRQKLESNASR